MTRVFALIGALMLSTSLVAQQAPDRSKPPAPGPAPSLKVPPVQKRTLSNGLNVWVVEMHEVPVVDVTAIVKSGAAADPTGKYGLASFTAAMLDEGAGSRDALQLSDAIDFLGASLSTGSSWDSSSVNLHAMVSKIDAALPIFADVLLHPAFSQSEMDRVRKQRLTSLLQTRDNASALASASFARAVFGPRHRYGTPSIGNEVSNGEMTVSELKQFHSTYYQPQNAYLLVVGDITPDAIMPKLEKALGAWKNVGTVPKPTLPATPQHGAREIILVDKPGAAQSAIRLGWIGVARSSPDYFVLDVMNTILGGSFTSRLNQNLREEHGYAYGASSRFDMRLSAGPFMAAAGVQTDKTAEALQEFFKELNRIQAPMSAEELTKAKNYVALSFPGEFETINDLGAHLEELVVYKLPDDYFQRYVPNIQAVTAAAVQKAAATYIQPKKMSVVVVGDRKVIEPKIRALNLGPIQFLSVDEVVGS